MLYCYRDYPCCRPVIYLWSRVSFEDKPCSVIIILIMYLPEPRLYRMVMVIIKAGTTTEIVECLP